MSGLIGHRGLLLGGVGASGVKWRAADVAPPLSISLGGKRLTLAANESSVAKSVATTQFRSSGRWYFEIYFEHIIPGTGTTTGAGIASSDFVFSSNNLTGGIDSSKAVSAWPDSSGSTNRIYRTGGYVSLSGVAELDSGKTLQIAIDIDNRKLWAGVNGSWNGNPAAGTGEIANATHLAASKEWSPAASPWSSETSAATILDLRCALSEFGYAAPSGFSPWAG